jgi:hypothetical protein
MRAPVTPGLAQPDAAVLFAGRRIRRGPGDGKAEGTAGSCLSAGEYLSAH